MNKKSNKTYDDDSIDLVNILSVLWKNKKHIINTVIIFTIVGVIYSLSIQNTYKASTIFYPHIDKTTTSSGLKSIADLAGINIGTETSDNIPPTLYPNLLNSPQFKIEILNEIINVNGTKTSYRDYLKNNLNKKISAKKIFTYPITFISKSNKQ